MKNGGLELKNWCTFLAGGLILLAVAFWTWLSREFVYGEGHTDRPIIEFVLLYLVAWGAWCGALLALILKKERPRLGSVLLIALCARLFLLPSSLIQENDVYRYVLDGQATCHGDNPFAFSPRVVPEMGSPRFRDSLQQPEAQLVLGRVGYPEIPTIYPPAAQAAFALGAALWGWDWMGQRMVFLAADFVLIAALILLLRVVALAPCWLLFYAWNPLILKEITNSAHLDILVALFLALFLLSLSRFELVRRRLWLGLAAVALGMAVLSKLYPVVLVPAVLLYLFRSRTSFVRIVGFTFVVGLTVLVGYLPLLSLEMNRLLAGLSAYASQWRMNEGFFALLRNFLPYPRMIAAVLISLAALFVPWFRRTQSIRDVGEVFQWILLLWFLVIPTPYPWYAAPLVALAVLRPLAPPSLATATLSGLVGLYYLSFFYEYHDVARHWWSLTRGIEHSFIWLTLILSLVFRRTIGSREGSV